MPVMITYKATWKCPCGVGGEVIMEGEALMSKNKLATMRALNDAEDHCDKTGCLKRPVKIYEEEVK